MRSVSLEVSRVAELLKNKLTEEELGFFKSHKREFRCMWREQCKLFWLKFTITCKEVLGASYNYQGYSSSANLDTPLIELLDCLLCVDYNSVFSHVELTGRLLITFQPLSEQEEQKSMEMLLSSGNIESYWYATTKMRLHLVAAFIKLLPVWNNSDAGETFEWSAPVYWVTKRGTDLTSMFLEHYVASLQMMDVAVFDQLRVNVPPNAVPLGPLYKLMEEMGMYNKLAEVEVEQITSLEAKRASVWGKTSPDYEKPTFGWFTKPKGTKRKPRLRHEAGTIELLRKSSSPLLPMWQLVETCLPPLLARRYHTCDVNELLKNEESSHFMGTAAIFALWDCTFGINLLQGINRKHMHLQATLAMSKGADKALGEWRAKVAELLEVLNKAKTLVDSPRDQDVTHKSSEFLLEPCVLIQLPWHNVLLHQWLVAALCEVLLFEHHSLELRHWPLPSLVIALATDLLSLVKQLKERVVLGFAVMCKQVCLLPTIDRSFPSILMDQVILPSLSTLQFLISGTACNILRNIKKIAWSKSRTLSDELYVPSVAYTMENIVAKFFSQMCYNFMYWEQDKPMPPFPGDGIGKSDLAKMIASINLKTMPTLGTKHVIKPLSKEELFVCKIVTLNREAVTNHERVSLAFNTVAECVLQPGRVQGVTRKQVESLLYTEECRVLAGEVLAKSNQPELSLQEHLILGGLVHSEVYGMLLGSERETSIAARLRVMQLEVVEREQVVRLSNLLSVQFQVTPTSIGTMHDTSRALRVLTVPELARVLRDVEKRRESQDRDWLLQQLPDRWRHNISKVKIMFSNMEDNNFKIFTLFISDRIGRLVYNVAKNAHLVFESTGAYFTLLPLVQYLLPCYVSSFVLSMNSPNNSNKSTMGVSFQAFLTELVIHFEKQFHIWSSKKVIAPLVNMFEMKIFQSRTPAKGLVGEILTLGEHYRNMTHNIFRVHIGQCDPCDGELVGIFGLFNINLGLQQWTNILISQVHDKDSHQEVVPYFTTWAVSALEVFKLMYEVCLDVWYMPNFQSQLKNDELRDIFMSDLAMQGVELAYQMLQGYTCNEGCEEGNLMLFIQVYSMKGRWADDSKIFRHRILQCVKDNHDHLSASDAKFFQTNCDFLIKYYKMLKNLHKCSKLPRKLHYLHLFPSFPPEIKMGAVNYLLGNYIQLNAMIPLYKPGKFKKNLTSSKQKTSQDSSKVAKPGKKQKKVVAKVKRVCFNNSCGKTEAEANSFIVCDECVEQHYPKPNCFCSEECKQMWWQQEHMAEHLEFELGLGEFAHVNGTKLA